MSSTFAALFVAAALASACGTTVQNASSLGPSDQRGLGGAAATQTQTAAPTGELPGVTADLTGGSLTVPGATQQQAGTTSPTSVLSTTGPAVSGVAPGAAPITVGVVLTSTASAADYGFSSGESFSEQQVDDALFKALNKQGGIAGHQVTPVYAKTDPNSNNWATDFAAACATFTQDHHVAAVLGYLFTYDGGFEHCLTKFRIPHLATGFNIPDAQELAKHPYHRSLAVPTIDHRSIEKLQGAITDGVLTSRSKLLVAYDTCPGTENSLNKVALPFLKAHGIKVAELTGGSCNTGSGSAGAQVNGVPSALLKARQAGVDTITFLTVSEGPALLIVATAAESQGWHPTYIVSSLGNLSALEGQVPSDQLENVKGYGWMPAQDVGPSQQPKKSAAQLRCLALLKSQGIQLKAFGDFTNAYRMCDAVFAYEAALRISTVNVVAALDSLGTSFSNPDVLDGATRFGKGRENIAPAHMRSVIYDKSCSCFVYRGPTRPLP